jgi:hypothetical protein
VRVLGEVTPERVHVLQEADALFIEEIRHAGLYSKIAQAFAVLLPVRSVGVMGDGRTYDHVLALRAGDDRFHDGELVPASVRPARARVEPDRERSEGRQSRRLRRLEQAPCDDRVE